MGLLEETCEKVVIKKIEEDPEWISILAKTIKDLNNKEYPQKYIDVLDQKSWHRKFDMFEAYCFASIHVAINVGLLAVFQVPIGHVPVGDSQEKEMNRILKKLPFPFEAVFEGGTQDEDGYLFIDAPINALRANGKEEVSFVIVPPTLYDDGTRSAIPLEVGTTSIQKTYQYLCYSWNGKSRSDGLARWPYGHDRITVFSPFFFGPGDSRFSNLLEKVHGDFNIFPNPYNDEWK